jgi:hypothetical protein
VLPLIRDGDVTGKEPMNRALQTNRIRTDEKFGFVILHGGALIQFGIVASGDHIGLPIASRVHPHVGEKARAVTLTADYDQQNHPGSESLPHRVPQHGPTLIPARDHRLFGACEAAALVAAGVGVYSGRDQTNAA